MALDECLSNEWSSRFGSEACQQWKREIRHFVLERFDFMSKGFERDLRKTNGSSRFMKCTRTPRTLFSDRRALSVVRQQNSEFRSDNS